jgi:Zn finger protein HypA/HybF involved in hydrogenase expression
MTGGLDGNVLAGALREVFAVDVTSATAECAGCGLVSAIGQAIVYTEGSAAVARCPGCDSVVLRINRGPQRAWLDLRGVVCLQLELPDGEG